MTEAHDERSRLGTDPTRRVAFVLSNRATSSVTGWPIGFWLAELTHPFDEFRRAGWNTTLFSPEGGGLYIDDFSDPYADNGYSADDQISKDFLDDPATRALLDDTVPLGELDPADFDAVFLVGGQGPMETFRGNPAVELVVRAFHDAGKPTAVVCHATSVLLSATDSSGRLLVDGRTWTGFSSAEEELVETMVGQPIQPFWIEREAALIPGTKFVASEPWSSHTVVHDNLVTGQQQHSGGEAARRVLELAR